MPYKSLWLSKGGFAETPKSNFISWKKLLLDPPITGNPPQETMYVLGIYVETGYIPSIYKKKDIARF